MHNSHKLKIKNRNLKLNAYMNPNHPPAHPQSNQFTVTGKVFT